MWPRDPIWTFSDSRVPGRVLSALEGLHPWFAYWPWSHLAREPVFSLVGSGMVRGGEKSCCVRLRFTERWPWQGTQTQSIPIISMVIWDTKAPRWTVIEWLRLGLVYLLRCMSACSCKDLGWLGGSLGVVGRSGYSLSGLSPRISQKRRSFWVPGFLMPL